MVVAAPRWRSQKQQIPAPPRCQARIHLRLSHPCSCKTDFCASWSSRALHRRLRSLPLRPRLVWRLGNLLLLRRLGSRALHRRLRSLPRRVMCSPRTWLNRSLTSLSPMTRRPVRSLPQAAGDWPCALHLRRLTVEGDAPFPPHADRQRIGRAICVPASRVSDAVANLQPPPVEGGTRAQAWHCRG